jgi:hypothetical protein
MGWLRKNKNFPALAVIVIILLVYFMPMLANLDKAFTLYPKNYPRSGYAEYALGSFFKLSILGSGQFPLYNRYLNGGFFFLSYPVDLYLTPLSIVYLLFNEVAASKILWILFSLAGALGMFCLCRNIFRYNLYGSVFSSLVFVMSGFFAYLQENTLFYARSTLLLPLLLYFLFKSREDNIYIFIGALLFSFFMFNSALFSVVIVFFLFLFSLISSVELKGGKAKTDFSLLRNLFLILFLFIFFSSPKILSMAEFFVNSNFCFNSHSYTLQDIPYHADSANTLQIFYRRLFVPEHSGPGTMYLGFIPVILACVSFFVYRRENFRFLILLALFVILSFGPNSVLDLHKIFWKTYIFRHMSEIAKYYGLFIVFIIAFAAGRAFSVLDRLKNVKLKHAFSVSLVGLSAIWLFLGNSPYQNSYNFACQTGNTEMSNDFFQAKVMNLHPGDETISGPLSYFLFRKNIGLLNFYDAPLWFVSSVIPKYYIIPKYAFLMPSTDLLVLPNPNYRGELFFVSGGENSAEIKKLFPNKMIIAVHIKNPGTLAVNLNFDKNWSTSQGKIANYKNLLSIESLSPGDYELSLTYRPVLFYLGCAISFVSIIFSWYFIFRKRKRKNG